MSAYLEFNENVTDIMEGRKYLGLKLEQVSFYNTEERPLVYVYKTDCATITMRAPRGEFADVEVRDLANGIVGTLYCATDYVLPLGHHKCLPLAWDCYRPDEAEPIAVLNFGSFEYEASTDTDMHRNKKFAGPSSPCYFQ